MKRKHKTSIFKLKRKRIRRIYFGVFIRENSFSREIERVVLVRLPAFPDDNINRALESVKFFLVESGILGFGIRIPNPLTRNPKT